MTAPVAFQGVFPILVTPFLEKETIDLESFDRLVRFMADIGVDGVTILGVLGESDRMVDSEREELIRTAVAAAGGRIPVVVGTSHKGTAATVYLGRMAQALGAAAVMVTPSKEAAPSDERVFDYFRIVAEGTPLPIVLQDHPGSTDVHMPVPLILRMLNEIPSVACIKEEAPPTPTKIAALRSGMKERRVPILTGLGGLYGIFDLERGCDGYMTGFAFPEVLIGMMKAVREGRIDAAWEFYNRFLPLIVFEQQPGIAIRKEICRMRGLIRTNRVRHPGAGLILSAGEQLRSVLDRILPGVDITKPLVLTSGR
jgi:4-hydroxy-tetrahydrodipicolinate synthase